MPERRKIGLREVRGLQPGETIWDSAVIGFHARRQKEAVSFILFFRTASGRQRFLTIGRFGSPWTPDSARAEALRLLGIVSQGGDPAADKHAKRHAVTVSELCDQYMHDATAGRLLTRQGRPKRASTLESDVGRIERHIKVLLGRMAVADVGSADVQKMMVAIAEGRTRRKESSGKSHGRINVRGGKGAASRTVELLSGIMTYAIDKGMRETNPCTRVRKFAGVSKDRRLSDDEYGQLGDALRRAAAENVYPPALSAIRFLALSGWRSGEVIGLRWTDIDLARRTATLLDTKTGRSMRVLSGAACTLLREMPRIHDELVFPPSRKAAVMSGFRNFFDRVTKLAGLGANITPHTMRHSLASVAADLGYSEFIIAGLLGHRLSSVTARYSHIADASLLAAADVIARRIGELMGETPSAEVIPLRVAGG